MRKPIIVGNWKMNKLRGDAKEFVCAIEEYLTGEEASTYGIAAPFTCLVEFVDNAKNLVVAAQNCHWKESGAFTGEVSVEMLEDVGVTYCVIGHSERRSMFGDTDETVNLKASKLLDENIIPILCIGETEAQYDAGETEKVIREQISGSMKGLCPHCVGKMVVAYEPIWAIGTGKTASSDQAEEMCKTIRETVKDLYNEETAENVRIQYGGSVKPANVKELMSKPDIDGGLVGGASLKPESYLELVNYQD